MKGQIIKQKLPTYRVRTDGGTQPRSRMDPLVVSSYAEQMKAGAKFPDIDVFFDGKEYWLSDGHYRTAAAKEADKAEIGANIYQGGPREAWLHALPANRTHGQPLSREDKRRAARKMFHDSVWSKWSDRAIGKHIGVSHMFVAKIRRESGGNVSTSRVGADHKTYRSERTVRRDKHERETEAVDLLSLASELGRLAGQYQRFAEPLNKLMVHVRRQAGPSYKKRTAIEGALRAGLLSMGELAEETLLDRESLTAELTGMTEAGVIEVCDARGKLPTERDRGGKWTPFWRLRGQPVPDRAVAARDNDLAGPSGRSSRQG